MEINSFVENKLLPFFYEAVDNHPLPCALFAISLVGLYSLSSKEEVRVLVSSKKEVEVKAQPKNQTEPLTLMRELEFNRLREAMLAPLVRYIFVTGDKGCGKSTLIRQVAANLQEKGYTYIESDEGQEQISGKTLLFIKNSGLSTYSLEQLDRKLPEEATCIFKSSRGKKPPFHGTEIAIPPLSIEQIEEILILNSPYYFQAKHGIAMPAPVVRAALTALAEYKKTDFTSALHLLSRACIRDKNEGKSVVESATVQAIVSQDINAETPLPENLIKVTGRPGHLAVRNDYMLKIRNRMFIPFEEGNVLLTGPEGCGKTSLAICFAHEIRGEFDLYSLRDIQNISYDNVDKIVHFLEMNQKRLILFIDNIDSLPNNYKLNREISRMIVNGLRCIGATSKTNFADKHFHPIKIEQPDANLTLRILKEIKKSRFEEVYKIAIPDEVIVSAVKMKSSFEVINLLKSAIIEALSEKEGVLKMEHLAIALSDLGIYSRYLQEQAIL